MILAAETETFKKFFTAKIKSNHGLTPEKLFLNNKDCKSLNV